MTITLHLASCTVRSFFLPPILLLHTRPDSLTPPPTTATTTPRVCIRPPPYPRTDVRPASVSVIKFNLLNPKYWAQGAPPPDPEVYAFLPSTSAPSGGSGLEGDVDEALGLSQLHTLGLPLVQASSHGAPAHGQGQAAQRRFVLPTINTSVVPGMASATSPGQALPLPVALHSQQAGGMRVSSSNQALGELASPRHGSSPALYTSGTMDSLEPGRGQP